MHIMKDAMNWQEKLLAVHRQKKTQATIIKKTLFFVFISLFLNACAHERAIQDTAEAPAPESIMAPANAKVQNEVNSYADALISSYTVKNTKQMAGSYKYDPNNSRVLPENSNDYEDNLWEHALYKMEFVLPKHKSARVDKRTLKRNLQEGHLFAYYIINELKTRNMPLELIAIPMIESTFNPKASSRFGVGLWQFTTGTARVFKLHSDKNYDMRKDVIASTNAALNYFSYLHKMFKDWNLAVAAYNCGEGTVQRAIRRNRAAGKPTDVWSLPIPQHTKNYVSKLYGFTDMIRKADKYGITLPNMPFRPVFRKVSLNGQTLAEISKHTGVSVERLLKLNAGFNSAYATTKHVNYVLVPIDDQDLISNYVIKKKSLSAMNK